MAPTELSREQQIQQDVRHLHKLGYAQQLFREMGGFSNFAISFSIISILAGALRLCAAVFSLVTSISTLRLYEAAPRKLEVAFATGTGG